MTTWEIGQVVESIFERGERAAALELISEWVSWSEQWIDDYPERRKINDLHS